ncbi:hypothetical protein Cgig2_001192 [Carnegiea gigantea]|uniref:Uncharacterized protein n=1 Tax=Carnegiea gigantea TaxID=171969 RepID=A0A9Q1JHG7_9CARY|nr:hypothetical protein Cgig2_001192 [Carnegiea gigantea]
MGNQLKHKITMPPWPGPGFSSHHASHVTRSSQPPFHHLLLPLASTAVQRRDVSEPLPSLSSSFVASSSLQHPATRNPQRPRLLTLVLLLLPKTQNPLSSRPPSLLLMQLVCKGATEAKEPFFCAQKTLLGPPYKARNIGVSNKLVVYPNAWIIHTGANDHMCHNRQMFSNLTALINPARSTA